MRSEERIAACDSEGETAQRRCRRNQGNLRVHYVRDAHHLEEIYAVLPGDVLAATGQLFSKNRTLQEKNGNGQGRNRAAEKERQSVQIMGQLEQKKHAG